MPKHKYSDDEIYEMDNVSCEVAGKYLGLSGTTIRQALREGRVPFGVAVRSDGGHFRYAIPGPALVKFKQEGISIVPWLELRTMVRNVMIEALQEVGSLRPA